MSVGVYTPNAKHSTSISCDCSYLNLASSFVIKACRVTTSGHVLVSNDHVGSS